MIKKFLSGIFIFNIILSIAQIAMADEVTSSEPIIEEPEPPLSIVTTAIDNGTVGRYYNFILYTNKTDEIITWKIKDGNLPAGLRLNSNGVINGIPERAGSFKITLTTSNSSGETDSASFTIEITPSITTTSPLPYGRIGKNYNVILYSSETEGIIWSLIGGSLPDGLRLSPGGIISGYPLESGTFLFEVRASLSSSNSTTMLFSITVREKYGQISINTISLPKAVIEKSYSAILRANITDDVTWSLTGGDFPEGLRLSSTGLISGTPKTSGEYEFEVKASVSDENTASTWLTISVSEYDNEPSGATSSGGSSGCNFGINILGLPFLFLISKKRKK